MRAHTYDAHPALTCWYFSYWSGIPNPKFGLYLRQRRVIFSFATNNNLFAVMIAWPITQFQEIKVDVERHFMSAIDAVPEFGERVRSGRREERFYGIADLPNFFRRPWGDG
jgi:hypothetical protein